jgi:protein-tyrosine-phosphatase/predicted ATP-grasp superfamily ATP-dependent carboligase
MKKCVLVVGDNVYAGLQTVRSLGRAGLDVHLVVFEPHSVTKHSRYVRKTYDFGQPLLDTDRFVSSVLALVEQEPFELVIPTSDDALVPLMTVADDIRRHAHFAAPDQYGFTVTQQKDRTVEFANRLGIRTPKTLLLKKNDCASIIGHLGNFPLVLKPISSVTLGKSNHNSVKTVQSIDEMHQRLPEMLEHGPVLVQEYCPGTGLGLDILADRGRIFAAFQHRRVHEDPAGGPSTYRVSEPLSECLLDNARRFCREICWTGPAMFEYKVHPETNEAVLMEVNGRLWGSIALPIQAGVNFPRLLYEMLVLNKTTETFTYRVPYFVRNTSRDIYWLQANLRTPSGRRDLIKVPLSQVVKEIGNIFMLREGFDIESVSDPIPGLVGWWHLLLKMAGDVQEKIEQRWWMWVGRRLMRRTRQRRVQVGKHLRASRSLLFVCTGNINRSAVAASRMDALARGAGGKLKVASAGLVQKEGRSPCDISKDVAADMGVDISGHRSSILTPEMLDEFDAILVMETSHLQAIRQMRASAMKKTFLLSGFDPSENEDSVDIADPYGGDRAKFKDCYQRVVRCVNELDGLIARHA